MPKLKKRLVTGFTILLALALVIMGCSSKSGSTDPSPSPSQSEPSSSPDEGGQSQAGPRKGGQLTIAYGIDVSNFDPIKGSNGADHALLWPVYETLVKFTPDMKPLPGLAKSWEFADDKTLVLHLREGVTFHDGSPFNAEAVKFNIERINSEGSSISDLKAIESVEVVDDKTVKLHLSKPDSSILLALTDRGGMMVSPAAVQQYGEDYSQHPVGAGPFKVAKHVPGEEIVYEAFGDYWDQEHIYLDKMTVLLIPEENSRINSLKSGKVDFVPGIQPQNIAALQSASNIVLSKDISLLFRRMYINTEMEPFNHQAVRLAVTHAINRDQLVQAINFGEGEAAHQPFPSGYWAYDENVQIKYDPEKSKQLLKDAGLSNVSFKLLRSPDPYDLRLADLLKAQLAEAGITVEIEAMEPNAAVSEFLVKKSTTALLGNWTGRADPQLTINSLYSKDSFYNVGKATTPNIENWIQEAAATYDMDQRAALYGQITKEVMLEQGFAIPLFFPPVIVAMDKKVHGYEPNMLGKPIFSTMWVEQ